MCRKEMVDCAHMLTVNFLPELCIHSQTCSHFAKRLYLLSVTMNCQHNRALNLTNFDCAHMFNDHFTKRRWLETVRSTMHNMGHITRRCAKGRGIDCNHQVFHRGLSGLKGSIRRGDQHELKYGLQTATLCFVNETSRPGYLTYWRDESERGVHGASLLTH